MNPSTRLAFLSYHLLPLAVLLALPSCGPDTSTGNVDAGPTYLHRSP